MTKPMTDEQISQKVSIESKKIFDKVISRYNIFVSRKAYLCYLRTCIILIHEVINFLEKEEEL